MFTPENIKELQAGEVFVYGANEGGIHGAGAAKLAMKWGARFGKYGFAGQTYGIPTKDKNIQTLPLDKIAKHVSLFLEFARFNKHMTFLVTKIGCGLAGLSVEDIAPMFKNAPVNCVLPEEFVNTINRTETPPTSGIRKP
jgi:hypothetical protein